MSALHDIEPGYCRACLVQALENLERLVGAAIIAVADGEGDVKRIVATAADLHTNISGALHQLPDGGGEAAT